MGPIDCRGTFNLASHSPFRQIHSTSDVLNKLDVLSGFDELQIAIAYEIDGQRTANLPYDLDAISRAVPIYETLPGWRDDLTGARTFDGLPEAARKYIQRVEAFVGVPVSAIGVGPARDQVVLRQA